MFTTGYPVCIPSTTPRTFSEADATGSRGFRFDLNHDGDTVDQFTVQAQPDGTGDLLCPSGNRTINNGLPVDDSRRFAPIMLGDNVIVDGNWEIVNGVRFLSAHSTMVSVALNTKNEANQPDYMFLAEVEVDAPAFNNQRARSLIIGFVSLAAPSADVKIWTLHYDPINNEAHEFPFASSLGCDLAGGPGTCTAQGLGGVAGNNIFKIRHDVDMNTGAKAKLNPCAHLLADPLMPRVCHNDPSETNIKDMFAILSPIPHEIQARTGHKFSGNDRLLVTLDIQGKEATNGQYLFPFGVNLGGISFPEFDEIDLNAMQTPNSLSGIPWNLDCRLSPGGCDPACEGTPQPLDPFPFEQLDPRTQTNLPLGAYTDTVYSAPLTDVRNRILSYVDVVTGKFGGDATVLTLDPLALNPAAFLIPPTPVPAIGPTTNLPPVISPVVAPAATVGTLYSLTVVATDPNLGDTITYSLTAFPGNMTIGATTGVIAWTPTVAEAPLSLVTVQATDSLGALSSPLTFGIAVNTPPLILSNGAATVQQGAAFSHQVIAFDVNGGPLTFSLVAPIPAGFAINPSGLITGTATATVTLTVRVADATGLSAQQTFIVTVPAAADVAPVIISTAVLTGTVNVAYSYDVNATDANGDVIAYSLVTAPTGMTINPTTGLIAWIPAAGQTGANAVTVQATDGSLPVTQSFTVTVAAAAGNVAPVITSTASLNATQNVQYTYDVNATDANAGDTITYSLVTVPTANQSAVAMAINPTTGLITWTPSAAAAQSNGRVTFSVRATDNNGANSATQSVTVRVR